MGAEEEETEELRSREVGCSRANRGDNSQASASLHPSIRAGIPFPQLTAVISCGEGNRSPKGDTAETREKPGAAAASMAAARALPALRAGQGSINRDAGPSHGGEPKGHAVGSLLSRRCDN